MTSVLKFLGYAYRDVGDYRQSSAYFERLSDLRDSLKYREQESAAQDYAALYDSREKDLQIREEQEENRIAWAVAGGVCLLLVVVGTFACVIVRKNRAINRRNLSLVARAKEHMANRKELDRKIEENFALRDRLEQALAQLEEVKSKGMSMKRPAIKDAPEDSKGGWTEADRILFERIALEIKSRQLFRNPDFSRTELLKIIPVPQNKFAGLFKQFAGTTFTAYIQNLRMEYANELFIEHPDWSIDAVIKSCGMSRTAFYTQFLLKFGVRPDEFRKSVRKDLGNTIL